MEMTVATQHRTGTINMAQLNNWDPVDDSKRMVFLNNRYKSKWTGGRRKEKERIGRRKEERRKGFRRRRKEERK